MSSNKPRMVLDRLKPLHRSMLDHKADCCKFDFKYNKTVFSVVFCTDQEPYVLLIINKGADPRAIPVEVERGYRVDVLLDRESYHLLCEMLGFDINGTHGFATKRFFKALNLSVPAEYTEGNEVTRNGLASPARDVDEEAKTNFMGWMHNKVGKPRRENLKKTLTKLGPESYLIARKHNLSSRWTDVEEWTRDVHYRDAEFF